MTTAPSVRASKREALLALRPDDLAFMTGITSVLREVNHGGDIEVLSRAPNRDACTFPSDVVTCRRGDGGVLALLCKYEGGRDHSSYGHRGNVAYEAEVYREIVEPLGTSAPRFFGSYVRPDTGETWLVLEYVDGAIPLSRAESASFPPFMAARWIGHFHAAGEARLASTSARFLKRYDVTYYRQWAERTMALAADMHDRVPWLATLCARFIEGADALLRRPTIVHGEYTPRNTLVQGTRVCPVDWESAAIGAGEVDLAALTDGKWPAHVVDACVREYVNARWPDGSPGDFTTTLGLARMYWNFRWLGERLDWTVSEKGTKRLGYLRLAAERIGMLEPEST